MHYSNIFWTNCVYMYAVDVIKQSDSLAYSQFKWSVWPFFHWHSSNSSA